MNRDNQKLLFAISWFYLFGVLFIAISMQPTTYFSIAYLIVFIGIVFVCTTIGLLIRTDMKRECYTSQGERVY